MKVFLAGSYNEHLEADMTASINRLISFASKGEVKIVDEPYKDMMVDSGAFTFMKSKEKREWSDWLRYADQYGQFIKDHNVTKYFELDIDSLVGIKKVEKLRERIENRSETPCIPVIHFDRGAGYFKSMVKEYDYIALGFFMTDNVRKRDVVEHFPKLVKYASEHGTKVHALGYTPQKPTANDKLLYSADSKSWIDYSRYGIALIFRNGRLEVMQSRPEGCKTAYNELMRHNLKQFIKYAKYHE